MLQRVYTRVSKPAARYSDRGSAAEHCSACRFFMSGGDCARVLGRVLPQGWCKYFSREAVQRWNPLWQMGGPSIPAGATLDIDFLNGPPLDPRITFTRASTGTYFDATGTMRTAAINSPRFDCNPSTHALNGLLIEEARTNVALQSGDFNNAAWAKSGATLPFTVAAQAVAPDGTLSAASVALATCTGTNICVLDQALSMTANPYTFSVWLKGSVGGEVLTIMTTADAVNYYRTTCTLTTSWQRFAVTTPNLTTGTWFWQLGFDRRDAAQTNTTACTFYAWGGQIEQGAFATSYIPTAAAAATRAQDLNSMPTAPWMTANVGSWFAEFSLLGIPTNVVIAGSSIGGGQSPLGMDAPAGQLLSWDGSAAVITANVATPGAVSKGASAFGTPTGYVCLNAGAVASGPQTGMAPASVGFIEPITGPSASNGSGYIRRLAYWPRVLSNAEMQQVTT